MKKFVFLLLLIPILAYSQQLDIIPFCEEKGIREIKKFENNQLNLFETKGFKKAILIRVDSSNYKIMSFYKIDGQDVIKERILTSEGLDSLKQNICQKKFLDRKGQIPFLVGNTFVSIGVYSWAVPEMFFISVEEKWGLVLAVSTAFVGSIGPSLLLKNQPITHADAFLKNYGQISGIYDGFLICEFKNWDFFWDSEYFSRVLLLSSIFQASAGYLASHFLKFNFQQSFTISNYSFLGYPLGHHLDRNFDNKKPYLEFSFKYINGLIGFGLANLKKRQFTVGDNLMVDIIFGHNRLVNEIIFNHTDISYDYYYKFLLAGDILALVSGTTLGFFQDYTLKQAIFTAVGTVVGGAITAGLLVLPVPKSKFTISYFYDTYAISSSVSLISFITYYSLKNKIENQQVSASFKKGSFYLNPTAFFVDSKTVVPAFAFSYRF